MALATVRYCFTASSCHDGRVKLSLKPPAAVQMVPSEQHMARISCTPVSASGLLHSMGAPCMSMPHIGGADVDAWRDCWTCCDPGLAGASTVPDTDSTYGDDAGNDGCRVERGGEGR